MPAVLQHPHAGMAHSAPASLSRHHGHRRLIVAMGILAAVLMGLTAWTLVDRLTGQSETVATLTQASAVPLDAYSVLRVAGLQQTLRDNGYSIAATGMLDPLTRSAAADFVRVDARHPLDQWLANALAGTVLTARHDPVSWNARFGTDRVTQMVERPLTGTGGQLDAYGNITG